MIKKIAITSADGVSGVLISVFGKLMIRVYNQIDHSFKDYDIHHSDLSITINDQDAFFYVTDGGKLVIDHSPETLGYTTNETI